MSQENHVFFVMDGVRYDVYDSEEFENLPNQTLKSYSGAVWTIPSFFNMLHGYSPSGAETFDFDLGEQCQWLPNALQDEGYYTGFHSGSAWMAIPDKKEVFSRGFNEFDIELEKDRLDDFASYNNYKKQPFFHLFHVLEPHHPAYDGEENTGWDEVIRSVLDRHGYETKFNEWLEEAREGKIEEEEIEKIVSEIRERLFKQQGEALQYVDEKFGEMIDKLPEGTIITVTADHADMWSDDEEMSWGHNPNFARMPGFQLKSGDRKLTEVPYSRGAVKDGRVVWKNPEELESEWKDPRERR